ncbi:activating signal cointegrator 1 complex subunit 2, partial [Biomphalaria glabrata]
NVCVWLDEVYKLTTISTGQKGSYSDPVPPNHFLCLILMTLKGTNALGAFDGVLFNATIPTSPAAGFAAIGADSYGLDDFDNYLLPLFKTQTHAVPAEITLHTINSTPALLTTGQDKRGLNVVLELAITGQREHIGEHDVTLIT